MDAELKSNKLHNIRSWHKCKYGKKVVFSKEINNIASSLKIESGLHVNRQKLISSILNNFEILYNEYLYKKIFHLPLKFAKKIL